MMNTYNNTDQLILALTPYIGSAIASNVRHYHRMSLLPDRVIVDKDGMRIDHALPKLLAADMVDYMVKKNVHKIYIDGGAHYVEKVADDDYRVKPTTKARNIQSYIMLETEIIASNANTQKMMRRLTQMKIACIRNKKPNAQEVRDKVD